MRVINSTEMSQAIQQVLSEQVSMFPEYANWLTNALPKWLLKNSLDFQSKFLVPIRPWKSGLFQPSDGGPTAWSVPDVNGTQRRIHLSGEFDQRDAEAGTLMYFLPQTSLSYWVWIQNPILATAKDFFWWLKDRHLQSPNRDKPLNLAKYTLDTLPQHIEKWHQDLEREAEAEARLQRERMLREENAASLQDQIRGSWATEDVDQRESELAQLWQGLVPGIDYVVHDLSKERVFIEFKTTLALWWEARFQGNCMATLSRYRRYLETREAVLGSVRQRTSPDRSLFSVELIPVKNHWAVSTIEQYGYMHPRKDQVNTALMGLVYEELRTFGLVTNFTNQSKTLEFVVKR